MSVADTTDALRHDAYNNGPMWEAFGLTRAAYAVFPRRALQSMPKGWQRRFVALVNQMHEALGSEACDGDYTVTLRVNGRIVQDWRRDYRHTGPMPLAAPAALHQRKENGHAG